MVKGIYVKGVHEHEVIRNLNDLISKLTNYVSSINIYEVRYQLRYLMCKFIISSIFLKYISVSGEYTIK